MGTRWRLYMENTPDVHELVVWLGEPTPGFVVLAESSSDKIITLRPASNTSGAIARADAAVVADALARYAATGQFRPPTRVANVRKMTAEEVAAAGIVYVGRAVYGKGGLGREGLILPAHPLANPYRLPTRRKATDDDRRECVERYADWLVEDDDRMKLARTLGGKLLGCWCGAWDGVGECPFEYHAAIIARVADGKALIRGANREWKS